FSADGIDPASSILAAALPEDLGRQVADLGAGWGFLSAHVLTRESVGAVHLVEA
ncbi:MAG: methyltransferase, partial [Merismopedia sp. SIO2A8]|nr:methyltransferase [Merismopedia sp. SIO2A8]